MNRLGASVSLIFLSVVFLQLSSTTTAFNITKLFGRHPEFSTFNDYLTRTKLDTQINSRRTITVLAVENDAMSAVSGRTLDVVKKILSMHVVLDYYDGEKLNELSHKSTLLTTMFQATGTAENKQGFLNVTSLKNGEVVFGSAVRGSPLNAKLLKSVAAQPYNISVLQISAPIIAQGIDVIVANTTAPPTAAPAPAPRKLAPKKSPSPAKAPAPVTEAPAPSDEVEAPADAPAADAPADTPADAPADAPAADDDSPASSPPEPTEADKVAPASAASSGTRVGLGVAVLMGLVSYLAAF